MKVNNDVNQAAINGISTSKSSGANKKGKVEKDFSKEAPSLEAKNASAKVQLSERAQEMKKIKELAMQAPSVDSEKVKRLQELIDKGQYKVDSKKVADKMVDDELLHSTIEKS